MNCKAIIFDLDGTLLDTLEDLANSMNSVLKHSGFHEHEVEEYKMLIGNGLRNLVEVSLPKEQRNNDTIDRCLSEMRQEYSRRWDEKTHPYTGIPELLEDLVERNIKMAVLSNKADEFTKKIVEKFLAGWKFDVVFGERPLIPKKPNPQSAIEISELFKIPPREFIYIGDSGVDMKTANAAGMLAVGALWGFRPMEELKANGAKFLINEPSGLLDLL